METINNNRNNTYNSCNSICNNKKRNYNLDNIDTYTGSN